MVAQNIEALSADSVKMTSVSWVWEPFVPRGMFTLIAGVPGQGKSLLTCWLAARVSQKEHVVMSNSEDDFALILKPRLEAAGANLKNITFLSPAPIMGYARVDGSPDPQTAHLLRVVDEKKAALVILDPLQDHLEVSIYSPKVTQILAPLAKELASRNVAMVAISHTTKGIQKDAHPLYAVGGAAGGVSRVARIVHIFGPHPNDTALRCLAFAKANFLPREVQETAIFRMANKEVRTSKNRNAKVITPGLLHFEGRDDVITAASVLVPAKAGEDVTTHADKRLQAAQWLTERLAMAKDRMMPAKQIQEEAGDVGISQMTLRRADEEIVGTVKKRVGQPGKRGGGVVYWVLP